VHFYGAAYSTVAPWQGIGSPDLYKLLDTINVSAGRRLKSLQYALPARHAVGSAETLAAMAFMLTLPVLPAAQSRAETHFRRADFADLLHRHRREGLHGLC